MTKRVNILQELGELNSSLVSLNPENVYGVPKGYFDELAQTVLNRIKALEADNAGEEIKILSPVLAMMSKQMPYSIPTGYFDSLSEKALQSVQQSSDYQTAEEEISSLSPLLSGLKKDMPYSVPDGYFNSLTKEAIENNKPETKVISFSNRSWFRYAAAAVVTGVIILASYMIFSAGNIDPAINSHAWVKKNINKVSTDNLEEFINLVQDEKSVASNGKPEEIKDLIKDVPESEIQNFLNETAVLDGNDDVDLLLN